MKCNVSTMIGLGCEYQMFVPRPKRARERGHIKDLWCPQCGERHGFREYQNYYKTMSGEVIY